MTTVASEKKPLGLYLVRIGGGEVVHLARKTGEFLSPYAAICGAKANQTGNYLRVCIRQPKGTPVTCQKCLVRAEKLRAAA